MNYLRKEIREITSSDIINFCKEKYPEGVNLDYKKEASAKGLAKHFAAFSNTRGGDIIIGVEEDSETGVPIKWEGVKNEKKIIESINQSASNVDPLPTYSCHVTDPLEKGKVFVVIRISEGDATPYYVYDDNNIYIRSHNITKLIDLASPDYTKVLFEKSNKAEVYRENNLNFVKTSFGKALELAEKERIIKCQNGKCDNNDSLGSNSANLEVSLQPFFSIQNTVSMKELVRIARENDVLDISNTFKPYPRGLHGHMYDLHSGHYRYLVLQASGVFYWIEDIASVEDEIMNVRLFSILHRLIGIFGDLEKVYNEIGYVGVLSGKIVLDLPNDVRLYDVSQENSFQWRDPKISFLNHYVWDMRLDTNILNVLADRDSYIVELMKQIEWDLGFDSTNKDDVLYKTIAEISKRA
ncbi:ATP-binding protein [bacterium]|nr:ATP-binding protein [bacterium]